MKPSAQALVATLVAVLLSGVVTGQVKSEEPIKPVRISGRVSDASGAAIQDAAVVVKLAGSTDTTASTKTSETGESRFWSCRIAHMKSTLRLLDLGRDEARDC